MVSIPWKARPARVIFNHHLNEGTSIKLTHTWVCPKIGFPSINLLPLCFPLRLAIRRIYPIRFPYLVAKYLHIFAGKNMGQSLTISAWLGSHGISHFFQGTVVSSPIAVETKVVELVHNTSNRADPSETSRKLQGIFFLPFDHYLT